uniref:Uncharacterized protein n=1 Tax=Anguilla anguilla TaxID=7936 RepID=A0A0E9V0R8_ANGAN
MLVQAMPKHEAIHTKDKI